jgi:hypothetical protein
MDVNMLNQNYKSYHLENVHVFVIKQKYILYVTMVILDWVGIV